ncbi:MAG: hypothetical protein C3F07_17955 [Anaerolineales bacterium]|nr:MAG: hypothetical protein C3F07_17955 [Anaerolineales bacterium]
MQKFITSKVFVPLLFSALILLAYGWFVPFTGFYWDDWVFAWIGNFLGPAEFFPAFIGIRPFLIPIFFVTTSLVPAIPVYWQIFALIIRLLAGLSAWFALNRIWPTRKGPVLVASLLFLIFPAYSQHWVAYTHINQEWVAFILYLLSFGLTASALRNPDKFKSLTVFALVLFFEGLFATEYFFGMEPLRFLFIWVIVSEDIKEWRSGLMRSLKIWSPYLLIWLVNAVWLAYYYSLGYNSYDLEVLSEPLSPLGPLLAVGEAVWKAGLYSWFQVLELSAKSLPAPSTVLTLGIIGLTFVAFLPLLNKISETWPFSRTTTIQFALIGLIGIILGRVPSYAAGLPFRLQSSFDRFAISMMLGGSLFIVGLVEWLIRNPRIRIYAYVLLIALGTGQQFFNGNIFRRDWERQQEIFWQFKWRIPSLAPDTLILTDEIAVDYESDLSLVGPINWIYDPDFKRGDDLHYLLLYINSRLGGTLPSLEPDTEVPYLLRTVNFRGNTSRVIVIHMPENGCLRVLDPSLGDEETYRNRLKRVVEAIPLSDPSLIREEQVEPPVFLSEPDISWCYYYTRAELARQLKDWDRILSLQAEANTKGYEPADPFEWLPFIEANAMTGEFAKAIDLSENAIKTDGGVRVGVCKVWERVQAQGPAGGEAETQISQALTGFRCAR